MDNRVMMPWMMLKRRTWNIFVSKPQPKAEEERPTTVELLFGSQRRSW